MESGSLSLTSAQLVALLAIQVSFAAYAFVVGGEILGCARSGRYLRLLWCFGGIAAWAHAIGSLILFHGGSQTAAMQAIADETNAILGFPFGYGLLVNYFFLLVWLFDLTFSIAWPAKHEQMPLIYDGTVLGFLGFIFFNGFVVFKDGWVRALGVVICLALAGLFLFRPRGVMPSE